MDLASLYSSDVSEALSNDTFAITRRGRQDMLAESRIVSRLDPLRSKPALEMTFLPSSSCISAPCSRRQVGFSGSKIINEGEAEAMSYDEMEARWWTQDDLEDIKQAAKALSLQLRRNAKDKGCYVESAHKKTSLMLANNFKELVKLSTSSPDQDLRHWCARNDGRRGLERFASKEYGRSRKDDVIYTRNTVFEEQSRQRENKNFDAELIAKVSKEKSRRARTFALFMGEADAQAVGGSVRGSAKRSKLSHAPESKSGNANGSCPPKKIQSMTSPVVCSSA